jgi:hypothetical protein
MARGGAKPGERRGGRAKGTPNKKSLGVTERLETIGCDPIEGMARIAMLMTREPHIRHAVATNEERQEGLINRACGMATCELRIPKSRCDGIAVLELIEKLTCSK